jgi:hypothetical protein
MEDEARSDLDQRPILGFQDLVVAEPDLIVDDCESVHMIEEGLALWMMIGHREYLKLINLA